MKILRKSRATMTEEEKIFKKLFKKVGKKDIGG